MRMNKKILISVLGLIIAFIFFFVIWKLILNNDNTQNFNNSNNNEVENELDISEEGIDDECTEEYFEYGEDFQDEIKEANSRLENENTHFLIKNRDGYICIYYLNENKEEFLYKNTNISTDYLSQKDLDDLDVGIEVIGIEELNKVLEDFE